MNGKTGGRSDSRRAGVLAVVAVLAILTAGCGVHISVGGGGSAPTGPAAFRSDLAYARCMRTHGVPNFPVPSPSQRFHISGHINPKGAGPLTQANEACEHLLPPGSTGTEGTTEPATDSPPGPASTDCLAFRSPCFAPRQLRAAYGIQPLLDHGITGRGQTIVLPEFPPPATGSPSSITGTEVPAVTDVRQDLARFDSRFGLPAARLQVVNTLAHAPSPWLATLEEVADTEVVHAAAPDAAIREVLIPSSDAASPGRTAAAVLSALRLGLAQGAVVSLSAGAGEQCFTPAVTAGADSVLRAAERDHVTVVISTGDSGAAGTPCPGAGTGAVPVKGVDLPASDPLALAVGGTSLQASRTAGAYAGETAWNIPPPAAGPASRASGGGFSQLFPRPAYQAGIADIEAARGIPDVAADADPRTGMALAISGGGQDGILIGGGGTSVAAPLWAAVIALADQYAGRDLGFVNPALYRIGRSASYHQAFHDVTAGTNTVESPAQAITGFQAAPGWDPVTGWGSPNAQVLVPLLARYVSP
jgi:subtilase family serine protease